MLNIMLSTEGKVVKRRGKKKEGQTEEKAREDSNLWLHATYILVVNTIPPCPAKGTNNYIVCL